LGSTQESRAITPTAALEEVTLPLVISVGPVLALGGVTTSLAAVVIGTGSDYFVDIPVVTVDTGGAPCGAPFYGRLRVRATPFFAPVWVSGIVVLANDGGHADGQKEEGENALHDDDELL